MAAAFTGTPSIKIAPARRSPFPSRAGAAADPGAGHPGAGHPGAGDPGDAAAAPAIAAPAAGRRLRFRFAFERIPILCECCNLPIGFLVPSPDGEGIAIEIHSRHLGKQHINRLTLKAISDIVNAGIIEHAIDALPEP